MMFGWETYFDTAASQFQNQSGDIYSTAVAAQAAAPAAVLSLVRTSEGVVIWSSVAITAGPSKRPQGWSEGYGSGQGQVPDMGFRYRLTGYLWTWDDKTSEDPRLWKGHGAEYDISATDYTYGSATDALDAGKAVGDANMEVMRVFSESNYPSLFAGRQFTYTDRLQTAWNAGAKEANDAYELWKNTQTTLDLGEPVGRNQWLGLIVIGLIIVLILWGLPKLYKGAPDVVAEVEEAV